MTKGRILLYATLLAFMLGFTVFYCYLKFIPHQETIVFYEEEDHDHGKLIEQVHALNDALPEKEENNSSNGTPVKTMTYSGTVKDGMLEGRGKMLFETGVTYEGEWKAGIMEGQGILTFHNGAKYEGGFKDGTYHGKGKITNPDGSSITGEWNMGKKIQK